VGNIKKLLACESIERRSVTPNMIWTDLCENIHLHYRNIRLEFSEKEFAEFRAAINMLGRAVEMVSTEKDYREGDPNFLIQQMYNTPLSAHSDYFPNRVTLEVQKDDTVHFHYRDLRLHFGHDEFVRISEIFSEAIQKFNTKIDFPYKPDVKTLYREIPLDLIQPYDEGHKPMDIDASHREGIDFVKDLIVEGKKIRPILVNTEGQRLDGFKRYMAHLELGLKKIDCYVDPFGQMGGQNNQGFLAD
jgi:hypothetical protein